MGSYIIYILYILYVHTEKGSTEGFILSISYLKEVQKQRKCNLEMTATTNNQGNKDTHVNSQWLLSWHGCFVGCVCVSVYTFEFPQSSGALRSVTLRFLAQLLHQKRLITGNGKHWNGERRPFCVGLSSEHDHIHEGVRGERKEA